MQRIKAEQGIALVMALGLLTVLTISGTAVTYYATTNLTGSNTHKARASAYDLAEAGMNDAMAILFNQLNTDGSVKAGASKPTVATLLPSTTIQYAGLKGSVTYSGTLCTSTACVLPAPYASCTYATCPWLWVITSTGKVKNGLNTQTRVLKRGVTVRGLNVGADGSSWSRFYDNGGDACLDIDNQTFVTNVATKGNLCLANGGAITGANVGVDVGGTVTITGPNSNSGPRSPSAGTGWTTPTNVYTSNGVYATNAINAVTTGATQDTTGFGFTIPSTAYIMGITATVERNASACCSAVQTITTNGAPTGGTFVISATPPGGAATNTVSIAYNATAATVQAALVTVYGSGNVTCSGGSLPTAVVCTFAGADANKVVNLMTLSSRTSWVGGTTPYVTFTMTKAGSVGALQDSTVQLLKAGSAVGTNKFLTNTWGTTDSTITYGNSSDLWGTTWTAADVNAANFGLRFIAKNVAASTATASLDYVSITVTYKPDTNGIGTSSVPVKTANIGGTCTYLLQAAHTPCTATDHVYATTITSTPVASNPALVMPSVDYNYWWANAMPGPKHFCTNPSPGLATDFFDNDGATTSAPNGSLTVNGEMAPPTSDYTCQVVVNGVLQGELSWNHTTHVMNIFGTIFVDGNFRWDTDGEIVHYFGRANIMSSKDDEIDALVCAGGPSTLPDSNDYSKSCLADMSNWDPSQNMAVLMSQAPNEYDQGGSGCPWSYAGTNPTCYNGHPPSGFQGILYSTADCLIHQNFQDSGPVICQSISLPNESGINPTYYTFPSIGNLTDGQKYGNATTATNFELVPGTMSGG
jgi:hypothetical protein